MKGKTAAIVFCLLFLNVIPVFHISSVKAATTISNSIISSDTTWTSANSPYNFAGNVLVDNGAKLTIQAGATLNLGTYYIRVNGSLIIEPSVTVNMGNPPNYQASIQVNGVMTAKGTSANPIYFNGGQITYTSLSAGWNEQTGTGDLIEYATLASTSITATNNIKLDHDSLDSASLGQAIVTNNDIAGSVSVSGLALVSGNSVNGGSIYSSWGDLSNGYPTITNNTVTGSEYGIGVSGGYSLVSNNTISNCQTGIHAYSFVVIGGQTVPYALIQNNLIMNNNRGIAIDVFSRFDTGNLTSLTIRNNTISNNTIGLSIRESNFGSGPTILFNNVIGNSNYNIYLVGPDTKNDIDATYNWWGTIDQQAINQSIYDFKNDFNLGKVTFVPYLTEPNPLAGSIPEFPSGIILLSIMIGTMATAVCFKRRKRNQYPSFQ